MKKAKLMLSALGIVAVLGSAFAFKASSFSNHVLYLGPIDQPNGATACQTRTEGVEISTGTPDNFRASTTSLSTGCLPEFVIDVDNQ